MNQAATNPPTINPFTAVAALHTLQPFEVFKPGTFTSSSGAEFSFTPEQVQDIADSYDQSLYDAPIVVGHPTTDSPSYGWAGGFRVAEDGKLQCINAAVTPEFATAAVRERRYPKVSLALFTPDEPANPKPGHWYVRHVGFLGGAAPAVPGLQPVQFRANVGVVFTAADELFNPDPPTTEDVMSKTEEANALAEREAALQQREQALAAKEAALAREQKTAEFAAQIAKLEADKVLLPAQGEALVQVMLALDASPAKAEFAAAHALHGKTPLQLLQDVLTQLKPQALFAAVQKPPAGARAAAFAAPEGAQVDEEGLALHNKIVAHQAAHPGVSYLDAARHIESQGA